MTLIQVTLDQALTQIGDGQYFLLPSGAVVVAAMGSVHFGLDRIRVAEHNARLGNLDPPADILIANTRLADDKTRTKYLRECRFRGDYAPLAKALCAALNAAEPEQDVWHIRAEDGWTIVYAGDPERSRADSFSNVGGRKKTEHLVSVLVDISQRQ